MNLDITLCEGLDCIFKHNCKRHVGYLYVKHHEKSQDYHSYFTPPPYNKFLETCSHLYWVD